MKQVFLPTERRQDGEQPQARSLQAPTALTEALVVFPKNKCFLMCLPLVNFKSLEIFLGIFFPILCFIFAASIPRPPPTATVSTPRHGPFVCREGPHLESTREWSGSGDFHPRHWHWNRSHAGCCLLRHSFPRPDSAPQPCREWEIQKQKMLREASERTKGLEPPQGPAVLQGLSLQAPCLLQGFHLLSVLPPFPC